MLKLMKMLRDNPPENMQMRTYPPTKSAISHHHVVFIPGFLMTPRSAFRHMIEKLNDQGYNVITIAHDYNVADLNEQAYRVIKLLYQVDDNKDAKFIMAGYSYGGAIAQQVAASYPDHILGCILLAPAGHQVIHRMMRYLGYLAFIPRILTRFAALGVAAQYPAYGLTDDIHHLLQHDKSNDKQARLVTDSPERKASMNRTPIRRKVISERNIVNQYKVPRHRRVIVFVGAEDTLHPPSSQWQTQIVFPGVDHMSILHHVVKEEIWENTVLKAVYSLCHDEDHGFVSTDLRGSRL